MLTSRLFRFGHCAALLAFSATTHAAELSLSGTVLGTDGKPLSDVTVSLALAKTSTTTDAAGLWSLMGTTTHVEASRSGVPVGAGRLRLEGGRLSVRFEGRDLSGRGAGFGARSVVPGMMAARAADVPDTLLYSWKGMVRLRDTVSVSQTGIVRTLDSSINAAITYGYLTDVRDKQTYRTVKIGPQVWMAQNLNYKVDSSFCYNNDTVNCNKYGRLYMWAAAMGLKDSCNAISCSSEVIIKHRGVCPSGWHVPSDLEWRMLTDTILAAATAGTKLKSASDWYSKAGTDDYGFRALPSGYYEGPPFFSVGIYGSWWSNSEEEAKIAWAQGMGISTAFRSVSHYVSEKTFGRSLRCFQD